MLDDRQPQPGASGIARARLIHPEEPFEYAFLVFLGDPDAPVGHRDLDLVAAAAPADRYR
ncbi:Uncharacterised protein [Mycobacteroides abscessus subsp. abscessus]|nr:Uncharacterised protein [Mycobacteroides abscessus subsp. abscessus]